MTVKDAKKRIEDLTGIDDNLIKIQECCLRNENAKEHIEKIEEESGINTSLRSLASGEAGANPEHLREGKSGNGTVGGVKGIF